MWKNLNKKFDEFFFSLTLNVEKPNISTKKLIKSHKNIKVYTSAGIWTIESNFLVGLLYKKKMNFRRINGILQKKILRDFNTHNHPKCNISKACTASVLFFLVNVQMPICFSTDLFGFMIEKDANKNKICENKWKSTCETERNAAKWCCMWCSVLQSRSYGNMKLSA